MWFPLARRILAHAGVSGVSDAQLAAVITPCNGSARQITDAVADLALRVCRADAIAQNPSALTASVV